MIKRPTYKDVWALTFANFRHLGVALRKLRCGAKKLMSGAQKTNFEEDNRLIKVQEIGWYLVKMPSCSLWL